MPIQQLQDIQVSTDGETLAFLLQPIGEDPYVFHSSISSEKLGYWKQKIEKGEIWVDIDPETGTISNSFYNPPDWIALHNPSTLPPKNLSIGSDVEKKQDNELSNPTKHITSQPQEGQTEELSDQITFIEHQFKDDPLTRLDLFKVLQNELFPEDKFQFGLRLLAARVRARKQIIDTIKVPSS